MLAVAELLRDEAAVLDGLVDEAARGRGEIELARLRELPPALRRLVVQRLADDAAGGLAPASARRLGRRDRAARTGARSSSTSAPGCAPWPSTGWSASSASTRARPTRGRAAAVRLRIPGAVRFGSSEVSCELAAPAREPGMLDRAALGDELVVRAWRPGDRMRPLGLGGSKSLQDLFTARRVPRARRAAVAVVESGGEIAWVAGRRHRRALQGARQSTREGVRLSVRPAQARAL